MKNLLSRSLDIIDYVMNSDLEKIAYVVNSISDNAKTSHIPSLEEASKNENDYAVTLWHPGFDKINKFACYTPELTELNLAILSKEINELPEELVKVAAANLTKAASSYGLDIPEELKPYQSKKFVNRLIDASKIDEVSYIKKTASNKKIEEKIYALEGKYPIHTPEHIKKAAAWFDKNYQHLSVDQILEFTDNITKQASALNYTLEKTAALDFTKLAADVFNPDLYNHISIRKNYLGDSEDANDNKELYNDLLRRHDEFGPIKTAYLVEYVDKEAGLDKLYNKGIVDPLRSVLAIEKKAGLDIDGKNISLDQIRKLKSDELTELLGNDVIKELKGDNGLEVLASLPTPIRKEIIALL